MICIYQIAGQVFKVSYLTEEPAAVNERLSNFVLSRFKDFYLVEVLKIILLCKPRWVGVVSLKAHSFSVPSEISRYTILEN